MTSGGLVQDTKTTTHPLGWECFVMGGVNLPTILPLIQQAAGVVTTRTEGNGRIFANLAPDRMSGCWSFPRQGGCRWIDDDACFWGVHEVGVGPSEENG